MNTDKAKILDNICYTALVYGRINKKLKINYSKSEIEIYLYGVLSKTPQDDFQRIGKNFYATNLEENIIVTINANTYRIITVDVIQKKQNDKRI